MTRSGRRVLARMSAASDASSRPAGVELHDRDEQAFLVDLARLGGEHVAADVGGVARRGEERHAVVAAEDRRADRHVVQVPGGLPGIVGDEHVAGGERLHRVLGDHVLHREGHRVDVSGRAGDRLRHHEAAPVEDARGEVARLAHDRRERRPHERGGLLVDDADQALPADVERDRRSRVIGSRLSARCGVIGRPPVP